MTTLDCAPPDESAVELLDNLQQLLAERQMSESALSTAIGRNRGWLNGLIARKGVPNAIDCRRMADVLGCRIEDIVRPRAPGQPRSAREMLTHQVHALQAMRGYKRPEVHEVFAWYVTNSGRLVNHQPFEDYIELFDRPDLDANMVTPVWVGRYSLCSIELGLTSPVDLTHVLTLSDDRVRREVVLSHKRIFDQQQPDTRPCTLEFRFSEGLKVSVEYIRVLLPVREPDGRSLVLNFCAPMRRVEVSTRELMNFDPTADDMPVLFSQDR